MRTWRLPICAFSISRLKTARVNNSRHSPGRAHAFATGRYLNSAMGRIRVVRIIDRLNVGGPAKHVTWLTAGLDPERFETTLITGVVPESEGDMSYFARAAGVEPIVIEEMGRELSLGDVVVIFKILRELFRLKPHIVHTHKAKAGAVGRVAATIYKWLTPSALRLRPRELG